MSTKKATAKAKAKKAKVAKPVYKTYPEIENFTVDDLKELRSEFEDLLNSGADPDRLAHLRELGKGAQAFLKKKRAAAKKAKVAKPEPEQSAPAEEKDDAPPKAKRTAAKKAKAVKPVKSNTAELTDVEVELLCEEMNAVMSIVPEMDPEDPEIEIRFQAELQDLHLADFHRTADYPDKEVFSEEATKIIRKLGIVIPGEGARKPKVKGKKEFPSARQIIYKAWIAGEDDVEKLSALVNEGVMKDTIRTYLSDWSRGTYLPAGVLQPKMKDGRVVRPSKKK